jgi:transposase
MASIIVDNKKSGKYLRIVESYRDEEGKSRVKTLYNLGKLENYSAASLKRIGERLYVLGGGELKDLLGEGIHEEGRYNYGYYLIYAKVMRYYGLDRLLERIGKRKRLSYSLYQAVMLMLLERLHDPASKRSNYFNQQEYLGLEQVALQHLYRSLDYLSAHNGLIQQQIFQTGRDLFNQQLDVVFYDVTTFYFESSVEQEGKLRQKGFSKDGKIGDTQVVFAMLIDRYKQPIGYKLYAGNTFEGHTYQDMVAALKKEYQIERIVLVADRGMMSKDNLKIVGEQGYEFIMGERLKSLPATVQQKLLKLDDYQHEWISTAAEPVKVRYTLLEHEGRKLIATYSEKRAEKDRKEREEKIRKAEKLLKHPSQLKKKARHYFLKNEQGEAYVLDTEKIRQSQRYDGFLCIAYRARDLTHEQVLDHYHHLFQIEHSFRTFKSYLETRPMFHWTDERIAGHICLCYIAYALLNCLKLKLEKKRTPMSEGQIRKVLDKMQVSLIRQKDQFYYLRSKQSEQTTHLLKAVGEKGLPDLISKDQIIKHLR